MRRVLYRVAASVDGYIAGPDGEGEWIVHDPAVDFAKAYEGIDTVLLGRRTCELTRQPGVPPCLEAGRSTCSPARCSRSSTPASPS
jgi:dihydrofolate reductase